MHSLVRYALLLWAIAATGCEDITCMDCCRGCPPPPPEYLATSSPENQIENIEIAYRRMDCAGYAKILAPDFIFNFQLIDASDIGTPFWTHDQDSTGTCALLKSGEVSEIRINLIYSGRDTTINFPGSPIDSLKIRVTTTDLQVDQTDGTTWVVTDQQDMYFRKGIETRGEDPTCWFLYEWDDLPTLRSPGTPQDVRAMTWGRLKALY